MVPFEFTSDFDWWGPNEDCRHCAPCLYAFKRTPPGKPIFIPTAAADAAEAAGAGKRTEVRKAKA